MTTITEAAKPLESELDLRALSDDRFERALTDRHVAQKLARQLVALTQTAFPARRWTLEDLKDVLDAAIQGTPSGRVKVVEGRYFRKRVREQCAVSERYRESFALVILTMRPEPYDGVYQSILDAVIERLRGYDMVFIYRERVAMLLPRMRPESLDPFLARIRELVSMGAGDDAIEDMSTLVYPNSAHQDTQAVLDWAEDQLRRSP